jgi:DNA-binding SARP family transcriptional activator/TolB-like protein
VGRPVAQPVRFRTLGTLRLETEDGPVTGPAVQRHRLALLALLAVAPGYQVSRDRAVALLWPESDEQQGRTLLNTTVHALRRALGTDAIRSVGDALSLDPDRVDCDVIRIERHRVAGRLEDAVVEYSGAFLDGFHLADSPSFDEWLEQTREQLSSVHGKSLERLAMAAEERGDAPAAVRWWTMFARHLPYSQLGATRLVAALAAAGERAAAIQAGEQFAARLRSELDVEPDRALLQRLAELRAEWVATPAAAQVATPTRTHAPPPTADVSAPDMPAHPIRPPVPTTPREETTRTRRRHRAIRLAVAAIFVVAAIEVAQTVRASRPAAEGESPAVVLLVPFEFRGPPGLSYIGEGIADLVATRLSTQTQLRTVLPRPFIAGLGSASFASEEARLEAIARTAREQGAGRVLLGSIEMAADTILVRASIADARTGPAGRPLPAITGPADSLLALVDRLAAQLLVGQSVAPTDGTPGVLAARPLAAIEPYLRGRAAYRRGEWSAAATHFQHALETDSTFAQAALGLALAENFGGNTARWNWAMNTLQAQQGQLDRAEFLMWDALIGRALSRRKAAWTEVAVLRPDQPEGWYELGDVEYHWGSLLGTPDPLRAASDHFTRSLRTDPGFAPAMGHLVELLAGTGPSDALRTWSARYFSVVKPRDRTHSALGWMVALALGDGAWADTVRGNFRSFERGELRRVARLSQTYGLPLADADSALRLFVATAPDAAARRAAMVERWVLESNAGHLTRADSLLGALQERHPASLEIRELAVLSYLYGEGSRPRAEAAMRFVRGVGGSASQTDRWLASCTIAWWEAFHGRVTSAPSVADALMAPVLKPDRSAREFGTDNEVCARTIRAMARGAAGDADTTFALRDLDAYLAGSGVSRMRSEAASLEAVRLFVARGDLPRAMTAVRRRQLLQQEPFLLATQLLRRARLARQTGANEEAIRAYRHYLALRRDAERGPAADAVRVAAEELAVLTAER